jgi:hypothetical protein
MFNLLALPTVPTRRRRHYGRHTSRRTVPDVWTAPARDAPLRPSPPHKIRRVFIASRLSVDFDAGLRIGGPIRRAVCQQAGEPNPRNSKARQWRAVQSGVNRGISSPKQGRLSPKSDPKSSGKRTSVNGSFCADFRPLPAGYPQPPRSEQP